MRQTTRLIIALAAALLCIAQTQAQTIHRKKDTARPDSIEKVIVQGDTVDIIIPEANYGRFDRGLYNYIFIPKGKWGFGITASYGELKTQDIEVLSILQNIDFNGKIYSVRPAISYFYTSNMSVGMKLIYSRGYADLGNLSFNFDEDLDFSLSDISYYQQTFSVSAFHRAYVGLDPHGRFGIFNETDLSFGSGSSRFKRLYDGQPKDTRTNITQGALNFSPGVCIFVQDYVSFNISFGVFGLKWQHEKQTTDNIYEGSRTTSGANFRFNIFNINFGMMVVI